MDISWLIDKVLTGRASDLEIKEVEKWVAQSESNKAEFEDLKLLYESPKQPKEHDPGFYDGLSKIQAAIEKRKRKTVKSRINRRKFAIIAITMVPLIALVYFYGSYTPSSDRTTDGLTFNNTPLENTVTTLERKYNVSIKVEKQEVLTCRFSGTFSKTSTLEDIIQTLASAMNLEYVTLSPGVYKLTGQGCIR